MLHVPLAVPGLQLLKRVAALEGQLARSRGANEALASQNRALYGTLDETLAAAEHVSRGRGQRVAYA